MRNLSLSLAFLLTFTACASQPASREIASKRVDPVTQSVVDNLRQLPNPVFDAIFGQGASAVKEEMLQDFSLAAAVREKAGPVDIYNPEAQKEGNDLTSSLVAINQDIFIEGFYRNMYWRQNGYEKKDQPWLAWDRARRAYRVVSAGAEAKLLAYLYAYGTNAPAKAPVIRLVRGTKKSERAAWAGLKKRFAANDAAAEKDLAALAAKRENGFFFSNDESAAAAYGSGEDHTVVTIDIPKATLTALQQAGDVYVGYEKGYFEISFLTPAAMKELAKALVVK